MKLPDFFQFSELNALKDRMGIPFGTYGSLVVVVEEGRLNEDELDKLTSYDGLDIASLEDLRELDDGTLAYKNSRVLLYIRDHSIYGNRSVDPKFHVSNCETLLDMKRRARFARYVVATRLDGTFRVNLIEGARRRQELRRLAVCQNCMDKLHFDGFRMTSPRPTRSSIVQNFTIAKFFERYPKILHIEIPIHDSDSAPLNDYSPDFSAKSNQLRVAANWQCQNQECGVWLGTRQHRRYLHVHHINGLKSDDSPENLRVLCIGCHAEQPSHGHMRSMPDYRSYRRIKETFGI